MHMFNALDRNARISYGRQRDHHMIQTPKYPKLFRENPSLTLKGRGGFQDVIPERVARLQSLTSRPARWPLLLDDEIDALINEANMHASMLRGVVRRFVPFPGFDGAKKDELWNGAAGRAQSLVDLLHTLKDKPLLIIPELPDDILWRIFTLSAITGGFQQAKTLSLVSHQNCIWAEPYLFSGINTGLHLEPVDSFLQAVSQSPRLQRVGKESKLLILHNFSSNNALSFKAVLSALASVTAVAIIPPVWASEWPAEFFECVKKIQWHPRVHSSSDPFPPFFLTVTHLSLNFADLADGDSPASFQWAALNTLSSLHILAVDTSDNKNFSGSLKLIQSYTAKFDKAPQLELILWRHHFGGFETIYDITDDRLIVCNSEGPALRLLKWLQPELTLGKHPPSFWSLRFYDQGLRLVREHRAHRLSRIKDSVDV